MTLGNALSALPGPVFDDLTHWLDNLPAAERAPIRAAWPTLGPLFAAAPYLAAAAARHPGFLARALDEDQAKTRDRLLAEADAAVGLPEADLAPTLRRLKAELALLSAIAETGSAWSTEATTLALSDFADIALKTVLGALMREAAEKGQIHLPEGVHPAERCGLALFALGKHGGRELNFSSDIDIVGFYEIGEGLLADPGEANKFYTRTLQKLVAIMEERDGLGNIFRTDLRLRPDPGATPLALGVGAALQYYEARGQNWERAAWIKARTAAGDRAVGEAFLAELAPFVWRKHLDFATIDDIQAIKRQINLVQKVGAARVLGHNVKLGRGGIREIEFFAQTQQLIAGGRDLALRVRPTATALGRLAAGRWIAPQTAKDLTETYWFLRAVENRLQMRNSEQTHSLPSDDAGLEVVAQMMGYAQTDAFAEAYRAATARVMRHYADLFAKGESLAAETGNLVFTGSADDPDTLETLSQMGFSDPKTASATIRKWHYGGYPATRAEAARAQLTALVPILVQTMAEAGNTDMALARFDHFVARLPAGVQLFSLLRNHRHLCRLLVLFMASAPRLADEVIHRAHVMDGLIDPTFVTDLGRPEVLMEKVDAFLADAKSYEGLIDRARLIGQEQKFLISAGLVSGTLDAEAAGIQFATLAQSLLGQLFAAVRREFAIRHGKVPGARVGLLAFGKMASREMSATSDLDFILLYDVPEDVRESDGEKPLAPGHYFTRLTQRLIAALAAPTAAGVLYEADMRLRPSGRAGPLATPLSGFRAYQLNEAWTWEHLALTRARTIFADADLNEDIDRIVAEVLTTPHDRDKAIDDVIDMRARLARDRQPRHRFDLKLAEGGLLDIEFIAQSAQLLGFAELGMPQATVPEILARMGQLGWLDEADALIAIHRTYVTIVQAMSTCLTDPFRDENWTDAFKDLLAHLVNAPDFAFLKADIAGMQKLVAALSAQWYSRARSL